MAKELVTARFRRLHLDFHTPPEVRRIGESFDPERFADTIARANVDVAVVFGKCHYGLSYYPSQVGVQHPGLGFDLLEQQIEALRRRGIAPVVYMSVVWDRAAWETHPDWRQVRADGTPSFHVRGFPTHWHSLCVNSPYVEEYLLPQVRELVQRYQPAGFWFDIVFYMDGCCHCSRCQAAMKREGLNLNDESDHMLFNESSLQRFVAKTTRMVREMWHRFIAPHVRRLFGLARSYGYRTMLHSCGSVRELIPDLLELGLDCLDPIQVRATGMDVESIKCEFGNRLALHGSIDTQQTLPFGGVADVCAEVLHRLTTIAPGGGFILAPNQVLLPEVPIENILTMYETAFSCGWYEALGQPR